MRPAPVVAMRVLPVRKVGERARARLPVHFMAASLIVLVALAASSLVSADLRNLEPAPAGLTADDVSRRADDNLRSDRTYMEARMTVESPRLSAPRNIHFISWEDRSTKRSFIRIREPAKDSGTGFLKLHPNLWMYVPRVERTMRVPPSMMLQSWMGSDFTNDDLVRESSEVDDYDHKLLGIDPALAVTGGSEETRRALVLEYIPHEEAAVVWGKIIAWIDIETYAPLRQEFYDEDGTKLRELTFSQHKQDGERYVPHRWTLTPLDKEGHATSIELLEMRFDVEIEESVFTKRHLQKARER